MFEELYLYLLLHYQKKGYYLTIPLSGIFLDGQKTLIQNKKFLKVDEKG
jgi:hypothetical protein